MHSRSDEALGSSRDPQHSEEMCGGSSKRMYCRKLSYMTLSNNRYRSCKCPVFQRWFFIYALPPMYTSNFMNSAFVSPLISIGDPEGATRMLEITATSNGKMLCRERKMGLIEIGQVHVL